MSKNIIQINSDEWDTQVVKGGKVVVDFYSDDCAPCEALAPKYEALAQLYGKDVKFVKIFRQENRELAAELGVRSSPTVLFMDNGTQVGDTLTGGVKRSAIMKNLDELVGSSRAQEIHSLIKPVHTETEILIVGGGPAGLAAAIYAAQAKRDVTLVDIALPGGQVSTTHMVSNYPGFKEPQNGMMLGYAMFEQAIVAGTKMKVAVEVNSIDVANKSVLIDGHETISARKLILATGSSPRLLGIPGEKEYRGQGVSYCATCDGKYYEDKHVVVVGGGNSAVEEALFLTQFVKKLTIVHQFDELQANKQAQLAAMNHPKIEFLFSHEPRAFIKTEQGMDIVAESLKTKESVTVQADGVFVFIGMVPNLELINADFDRDQWGYIKTDEYCHTNIPDVFAVGDIISKPLRQITIATGEGTIAGVQAPREIENELRAAKA